MTKRSKRLKQINAAIGHNKRRRRLFYLGSSISIVLVVLGTMFISNYSKNLQSNEIAIYNHNLCQQQHYTNIAQALGLSYKFDYPQHVIMMTLDADKASINAFNQRAQFYDKQRVDGMLDDFNKDCPLTDVKHHVANVNNNLVAHIPDDADYVSYDPNNDNAVYCHYLIGELGGSQCFYLRLRAGHLITDDISDIERVNLLMASRSSLLRKSDFYYVRSSVESWTTRRPTLYGMVFQTHYDGNHWAMAQVY